MKLDSFSGGSNCLHFASTVTHCVILSEFQKVFDRIMALRIVSSFLMQAHEGYLLGFSSIQQTLVESNNDRVTPDSHQRRQVQNSSQLSPATPYRTFPAHSTAVMIKRCHTN